MIKIRKSNERGYANHGWLETKHTFSFSSYYDPGHMGFRDLRVINEDKVEPSQGFGTHGHKDMEIISYVVEGGLAHKDSTGGEEVLRAGEFQRMTAGSGIQHSEFNPSNEKKVHFLQIWILPESPNLVPGYEQRPFSREEKLNQLRLVVSPGAENGSLGINQDVSLYASVLEEKNTVVHSFAEERHGWLQLISGSLVINGVELEAGDGVSISGEQRVSIEATTEAEFLLFDLK